MWELKFYILMQTVHIQKRNFSRTNESHKPHIWAKTRKEIGAHVRTRMNVSGFAKWQRVPLGSICAFRIYWCSTCRWDETKLAGGSQLRSLWGVSILSHPTTVTAPVGTPEVPRYHWFFLLVLPFPTWILYERLSL